MKQKRSARIAMGGGEKPVMNFKKNVMESSKSDGKEYDKIG